MGRYYDGDIEGKFWFGVQSSYAPERFGASTLLLFNFSEDDIPMVKEEIKNIKQNLGVYKEKFDEFFDKHSSYTNDMLEKAGFPVSEISYLLSEYADLQLGEKILAYLEKNGECSFTGEL